MTKKLPLSSFKAGFTLVELLVTVGIMLMLAGGGITALIAFQQRQTVQNGAKELQEHLRFAQSLAQVSEKPSGCDKLQGYNLTTADQAGTVLVTVSADCEGGDVERDTWLLPEGVSLGSQLDVTFLGLHGGVNGSQTVSLSNDEGLTYTFEITPGGEITQGEFSQ